MPPKKLKTKLLLQFMLQASDRYQLSNHRKQTLTSTC